MLATVKCLLSSLKTSTLPDCAADVEAAQSLFDASAEHFHVHAFDRSALTYAVTVLGQLHQSTLSACSGCLSSSATVDRALRYLLCSCDSWLSSEILELAN